MTVTGKIRKMDMRNESAKILGLRTPTQGPGDKKSVRDEFLPVG